MIRTTPILVVFLLILSCIQTHKKQTKSELNPHLKPFLHKSWRLINLEVRTIENNTYNTIFTAPFDSINDFTIEFKKNREIHSANRLIGQWAGEDRYLIVHGRNRDGIKMDLNGRYYIHIISDDLLWLSKSYFNNELKATLELVYRFRNDQHIEENHVFDF